MIEEEPETDLPSPEEMYKMLWAHADATAERVLERLGSPLSSNNLTQFMEDAECLRYPTRLVFTEEQLDPQQFAQPVLYTEGGGRQCALHVHPRYQGYPEALPLFVAYMAATIMYGESADSDLCEHLGAMLVKRDRDTFYQEICELADWRPTS